MAIDVQFLAIVYILKKQLNVGHNVAAIDLMFFFSAIESVPDRELVTDLFTTAWRPSRADRAGRDDEQYTKVPE